jgi:hypothetical protein
VKRRSGVIHLNCFDKALLSFEVNCTGQRIGYSGIFSVRGEPDPDRLRKAIMSTARAHPELMTTVRGGPLRHYRRVHDDFVEEVLEVQDLAALQAQKDSAQADIGTLYEQRIHEWINRPLDTRKSFPFRVLLLKKDNADCRPSAHFDRREDAGNRDAGSNSRDHWAGSNHDLLAMHNVCCHAGKGDLQVGESQVSQERLER